MSYRLHYSLPDSEDAFPMPGVQISDTSEQYPDGRSQDEGNAVIVDYESPHEIVVNLTADIGRQDILHELKKTAAFNLLVTESSHITEGKTRMKLDVRTTRYTRLKPIGFIRSAEAGQISLIAKTYDVPQDEYLLTDAD